MKNLKNLTSANYLNNLAEFIKEIKEIDNKESLNKWQYNDLLPKNKNTDNFNLNELQNYLIKRKTDKINKQLKLNLSHIESVNNANELISVSISIEWKKSKTWGSNPNCSIRVISKNENGNYIYSNYNSGSIGGCGYDKLSTSVANCLNQSLEVLKLMYNFKNTALDTDFNLTNHNILGYGSGYGINPNIEGGVGVSCYPAIFNKLGYNFKNIASGKTFDVFEISKN